MNTDHAQRINQELAAEAENKTMDEMERNTQPLLIVVIICFSALLIDGLLDVYATHKYAEHIKTSKMFVQALNGVAIDTGEGVATCNVRNNPIVANLSEVQQ